ncbi:MAG: D-alanyl-D-alanine carboxypeptidase [Clostridia bacterium]|nr:D-alanyl-D-alanine carboxypeptidase [Clostridia bacterium]
MKKKTIQRLFCLLLALILLPFGRGFASEEDRTIPVVEPIAAELPLPCAGAVLMEQETGQILYEKGADERRPIASVSKIMTLLITVEAIERGILHLEDKVPVSENAASMGGSQVYLEPGEDITLRDVLKAVFVSSANDGAVALAELVSGSVEGFVVAMNERAAALGMHDTVFFNPTGLDDGDTNLSTARDVATMSRALLSHSMVYEYTTIWIDSIRNGAFGLSNTNKLIRFYPGATGLKTGSTGKAKYCVSASAERNGLKLIAVVLAGESSQDRFNAAKTLLDHGFASYAFFRPEQTDLPRIPVWGGAAADVGVAADRSGILLNKADAVGVRAETELSPELTAPVAQGETVGVIRYKNGDTVLCEIPVTAEEAVPALGFAGVFSRLLRLFFTGRA